MSGYNCCLAFKKCITASIVSISHVLRIFFWFFIVFWICVFATLKSLASLHVLSSFSLSLLTFPFFFYNCLKYFQIPDYKVVGQNTEVVYRLSKRCQQLKMLAVLKRKKDYFSCDRVDAGLIKGMGFKFGLNLFTFKLMQK